MNNNEFQALNRLIHQTISYLQQLSQYGYK
jgi:hypothetical protein